MAETRTSIDTPYAVADFEADMAKVQPRFVDIWVIPPLLIWAGISQKGMGRWPRRLLFSAGVYMLFRNYAAYKATVLALSNIRQQMPPSATLGDHLEVRA